MNCQETRSNDSMWLQQLFKNMLSRQTSLHVSLDSTPATTYTIGRRQSDNSSKQAREMTRQSDKATEQTGQQSNNKQGTSDSESAVDSRARGKHSKRQRDVPTKQDIKKRHLDVQGSERRQRDRAARPRH